MKKKNTEEDLEKLFNKIEKMTEFKQWFGTPCKDFQPLCSNCDFWNKWERFKLNLFQGLFQ